MNSRTELRSIVRGVVVVLSIMLFARLSSAITSHYVRKEAISVGVGAYTLDENMNKQFVWIVDGEAIPSDEL